MKTKFKICLLFALAHLWFNHTLQSDELLIRKTETQPTLTPPDHAIQIQPASFNFAQFAVLELKDQIQLELYDTTFDAEIEKIEDLIDGRTIFGCLKGIRNSHFCLTTYGNAAAGTFFLPGKAGTIRVRYGGDGIHYIHRINNSKIRRCAQFAPHTPHHAQTTKVLKSSVPQKNRNDALTSSVFPEGTCSPPNTIFDIMIVYSDDARIAAGGTDAIRAEAINASATTEMTYQTCGLPIETNIVWLQEVSYLETGDYQDHLDRLTNTSDGILDAIHATRNIVGADFVSLFVQDDSSGGLAWCDSDSSLAFSIVRWSQASGSLTLAHEIGHNLGCAHNPEDADCQPYIFANGHNFFIPAVQTWRHSVMAYSVNNSTRTPYYSNPNCLFLGIPTGTVFRNNLDRIDSRKGTCEGFRSTRMAVWVDFETPTVENGSFAFPYDTVIEGVNRIQDQIVADIPILNIKPGASSETITISKPMIIRACSGNVTIGNN